VLASADYLATSVVSGQSSREDRLDALAGLRGPWSDSQPRTDIVIATSAFGVGIDHPNIRAVIHMCVPESLDRFYQEVGRGGRDGNASLSLLLWTKKDLELAELQAFDKIITSDRGLERWKALMSDSEDLDGGQKRLFLRSRPPDLPWDSKRNQDWNVRTLHLMAQAGLISLDAESGRKRRLLVEEDASQVEAEPEAEVRSVVVRLRRGDAGIDQTWWSEVDPLREQLKSAAAANLNAMKEALVPGVAICEALQKAYTTRPSKNRGVIPVICCGGCPAHRLTELAVCIPPEPPPVRNPDWAVSAHLRDLFGGESRILVTSDAANWSEPVTRETLRLLVQGCLSHGIEMIVAEPKVLQLIRVAASLQYSRRGVVFVQSQVGRWSRLPAVPTLLIDAPGTKGLLLPALVGWHGAPLRIVLTPKDQRDPQDPKYPVADRYYPQYSLPIFAGML
jgi:hypothetical protein